MPCFLLDPVIRDRPITEHEMLDAQPELPFAPESASNRLHVDAHG
jgi:hypothetical protein